MLKNKSLKGVVLVGLGATSYGMLATFVKLAYQGGYSTAEVTASQFIFGFIGLLLINGYYRLKNNGSSVIASADSIKKLMLAGTSMGFTSVFYYLAVQYINVSIAIVLLMQTVWIGVVLEYFLDRVVPSRKKIIAVILVLIGTALATNLIQGEFDLDWRGLAWGLLAAASFTTTMFTANRIATHVSSAQRSLFMLMGGAIIVFIFGFITQYGPNNFEWARENFTFIDEKILTVRDFNWSIMMKWGIIISLFGTIIPPLLLNSGFPLTGLGLGSIVSSMELPVSVMMAFFVLGEQVILTQWIGIALILSAIIYMNLDFSKGKDA
ncbi:MAG: EamA family transporter [Flavobacterium sp.]|nr:EamA family transporter [Candidatus Neoflavobacterium equi]